MVCATKLRLGGGELSVLKLAVAAAVLKAAAVVIVANWRDWMLAGTENSGPDACDGASSSTVPAGPPVGGEYARKADMRTLPVSMRTCRVPGMIWAWLTAKHHSTSRNPATPRTRPSMFSPLLSSELPCECDGWPVCI